MTNLHKNKIIFPGCSFTWGQGLWHYLPTNNSYVPTVTEYITQRYGVTDDGLSFKDYNRFPWLVGLSIGATPIVKRWNGGTDEESVRFLEEVLKNEVTQNTMLTQNAELSDIKYIIFQFTNLYRSPFTFFLNKQEYHFHSDMTGTVFHRVEKVIRNEDGSILEIINTNNTDLFLEWLYNNKLNISNFTELHQTQLHSKIKEVLKKFESSGVKTYIIFMDDSHLSSIYSNEFFNKKIIKLKYDGKEYETIRQMQNDNTHLIIGEDSSVNHESMGDGHPSLECHQVIAKCIIERIQSDQL